MSDSPSAPLPPCSSAHSMPFGANVVDSGVQFRLFAPDAEQVSLQIEGRDTPFSMRSQGDGWHELLTSEAAPGTLYRFLLPDGSAVPDPVSRYQPQDVHGPSQVVAPAAFEWHDEKWSGCPWNDAILYELHVGTFTPEGTFASAIPRLDHIAGLGITGIEIMCVSDFAGNRNWGYDGVLLYAPDSAYGPPEDMKRFIDEAHKRNLMVVLDVVWNHFGPEGNYLPKYFPQILSDRHRTPWGQALNFDGEHSDVVRELIIHNALYWVEEFHIDALRVDASHAMIDHGPRHILDELRDRVDELAHRLNRQNVHLVLENEQNIAQRVCRDHCGDVVCYTAQWNHDITHLFGAALADTPEGRDPDEMGRLGQALAEGFVIAAKEKGLPVSNVPPTGYIAFLQTHDLVGNRVFGERIAALVPGAAARAVAAIYLLCPQVPMLFMGEEWGASTPFPFFCDYHGDLADAVRKGRTDQLKKLNPAPSEDELARAPDPQAEATMRSAQLRWDEPALAEHAELLHLYRGLIAARRRHIAPLLRSLSQTCGGHEVLGPGTLKLWWTLAGGAELHLFANLSAASSADKKIRLPDPPGEVLWLEGTEPAPGVLGPWTVRWALSRQPPESRE